MCQKLEGEITFNNAKEREGGESSCIVGGGMRTMEGGRRGAGI